MKKINGYQLFFAIFFAAVAAAGPAPYGYRFIAAVSSRYIPKL